MDDENRRQFRRPRSRLMIASGVAMVVFACAVAVPAVCLRVIGDQFGLSLADRGMLGGVRMSVLVLSLLGSGILADRVGKRPFLSGGLFLIALGMLATASASGLASLLFAQALVGAGCGTLEALANPLVAELHPGREARALNLVNGLFSLGLVVAAAGTGELLQAGGSWRVAFLLCSLPALAGAILFAGRGYPTRRQAGEGGADPGSVRALVAGPLFWLLMIAMFLGGGCEAGMTFWGANFIEGELGASARAGAWGIAFFGAFMAVGRFGSGALVDRVSPLRLMLLSAAACALGTAGLCTVRSLGLAWLLFGLGGLFVACFWPTLLAVAAETLSTHSSALFALLAASGISGCAALPWGIGLLGDAAGLRAGIALVPASMAVQVAVLLLFRGKRAGGRGERKVTARCEKPC